MSASILPGHFASMLLPNALRCGLDGVCSPEGLDLLGQVGAAPPLLVGCLMSRGGKSGLELVTQGGRAVNPGPTAERPQVTLFPCESAAAACENSGQMCRPEKM